jgi:hypothetical protein
VLKVAQLGLFVIENARMLLSASDACGMNWYAKPVCATWLGVPEMTGAWFPAFAACEVAADEDELAVPSGIDGGEVAADEDELAVLPDIGGGLVLSAAMAAFVLPES